MSAWARDGAVSEQTAAAPAAPSDPPSAPSPPPSAPAALMDRLLCECVRALTLLLCVTTQVLCQLCDRPCLCPATPPQCPPGVPLVPDGCRCCQVCARQRGDSCTEMFPCDAQRGLECDHSASFPGEPGECVGQQDLGCELNGATYQEGESFHPSCDTLCRCSGGGVSCVPACPVHARLPTADCPHPQLVRMPGRCCRDWVCEDLDNTVIQDAMTAMRPDRFWPPALPRDNPPERRVSPAPAPAPTLTCTEQSTQWSACSRSCGAGVSTRVSNQNPACRLQMETRLCKVRPCQDVRADAFKPAWGQQGRCRTTYKAPGPLRLVHQGCYSTQAFQLRYCGVCSDSRCCTPYQTATTQVTFRCQAGRLLHRPVMMILSCVCHNNCPYKPFSNPALWGYRP